MQGSLAVTEKVHIHPMVGIAADPLSHAVTILFHVHHARQKKTSVLGQQGPWLGCMACMACMAGNRVSLPIVACSRFFLGLMTVGLSIPLSISPLYPSHEDPETFSL